uniref:PDEase domain-containing protein n=1 Tax=Amphora coffeiformis TaxID=265554 RepID=A0A7S3L3E6_9STRA
MDSHFREMREYIFETNEELARFRQVVVNTVLSTDIFDPELNELRKKRWSQAFSDSSRDVSNNSAHTNDARATVVIEHIMQASDVSHTMQHWNVYQRFNRNLFEEIMTAFQAGRCGGNPAEFWYEVRCLLFIRVPSCDCYHPCIHHSHQCCLFHTQGELKFFDNYIIPLAKKLRDCNVFGVSSDECLNYAVSLFLCIFFLLPSSCHHLTYSPPRLFVRSQQRNREEWEDRGRALVAEYVQDFHEKTNKYNPVHLQMKREQLKRENARMRIREEEEKQEEE